MLSVVECLRKLLNDERSIHKKEIEEMKQMMDMVTTMSDQFVQLVCWGMTDATRTSVAPMLFLRRPSYSLSSLI